MSQENVEVVRAYVEAYNAGGDAFVDFVVDFMAEDVEIVPDASRFTEAKPFRGREEYRRYIADIDQDWEGGGRSEIKEIFPEGRAMVANEVVSSSQGFRIARATSWSTSLLAIIVGILGVMNTMLMTVFERTHEIGILLAVGWKPRRIVYMVLCESALLGLLGGLVGVALGALGIWVLEHTTGIRGLLEPDLSPKLLLISVAIEKWRSEVLSLPARSGPSSRKRC